MIGHLFDCELCVKDGEKGKLKSGKYAKNNLNIKKQEQWLHMNLLHKYVKQCSFDSLDFEQFVAGETKTILLLEDRNVAFKRLELLSKLAHWLCHCRDWMVVKGLFEAILEAVELGEEDWFSDFGHYEHMITLRMGVEDRGRKTGR